MRVNLIYRIKEDYFPEKVHLNYENIIKILYNNVHWALYRSYRIIRFQIFQLRRMIRYLIHFWTNQDSSHPSSYKIIPIHHDNLYRKTCRKHRYKQNIGALNHSLYFVCHVCGHHHTSNIFHEIQHPKLKRCKQCKTWYFWGNHTKFINLILIY